MNVSCKVRMATIEDAESVAELAIKSFVRTYGSYNTAENMRSYLEEHFGKEIQAREIKDPIFWTLLVHAGDTLAGYAQLFHGPVDPAVRGSRPVQIPHLHVDSSWHGKGVAHVLMQSCLDTARHLKFETIWLGVWEKNPRAIAFYRKWDFQEVGSQIIAVGDDRQRDVVMQRAV
jgi:diamine N-acetyltransferase